MLQTHNSYWNIFVPPEKGTYWKTLSTGFIKPQQKEFVQQRGQYSHD